MFCQTNSELAFCLQPPAKSLLLSFKLKLMHSGRFHEDVNLVGIVFIAFTPQTEDLGVLRTIIWKVLQEHDDRRGWDTCRHWGTLVKAIVRNEGLLKTINGEEERLALMKFPHENHNKERQWRLFFVNRTHLVWVNTVRHVGVGGATTAVCPITFQWGAALQNVGMLDASKKLNRPEAKIPPVTSHLWSQTSLKFSQCTRQNYATWGNAGEDGSVCHLFACYRRN